MARKYMTELREEGKEEVAKNGRVQLEWHNLRHQVDAECGLKLPTLYTFSQSNLHTASRNQANQLKISVQHWQCARTASNIAYVERPEYHHCKRVLRALT